MEVLLETEKAIISLLLIMNQWLITFVIRYLIIVILIDQRYVLPFSVLHLVLLGIEHTLRSRPYCRAAKCAQTNDSCL